MLNNSIRLQYLQAMGIEVWLPAKALNNDFPVVAEFSKQQGVIDITAESIEIFPAQTQVEKPIVTNVLEPWDSLKSKVASCTHCGLCNTRTQTVFGTGNINADWLLIGDAPGQMEDEQGLPFLDNAGLLLTQMLRAIGLTREEVFITTALKCRLPNERVPHANEITSCKVFLQQQIDLIKPKIILAVGRVAAQTLLNTDEPLIKLRGKVHWANKIPVIVIYHPAYLLRSLLEKRKAWQDLQLAVNTFKNE